MKILILFVLTLSSFNLFAHSGDECKGGDCNSCNSALTPPQVNKAGPIEIITSGRNGDSEKIIGEAAREVARVAAELGYHVPHHQMIFAPSKDLSAMVPVGGYAAPHWHDGQQIVVGGAGLSGVMEFVVDGCPTCRSFYRDTTELRQQVSIIMHVAGHNDFAKASFFQQSRGSDPVAAKYELSQLMLKLYSQYDKDEVALYYQFLQSLNSIQDYSKGSYQHPDELRNKGIAIDDLQRVTAPRKGINQEAPYEAKTWPPKPTPSALQAFVANMPENAPEWKIKMAELYEQSQNLYPTVVQQKIANEGWASFSQYFIAKHLDGFNSDKDLFAYANLMHVVAVPEITNPYWLGLECWKNLYRKFRARPEIASMTDEMKKDQLFVQEAHSYMAMMDDYDFIRMALDEQWVRDLKLQLKREATLEELQARGIQVPYGSDQKFEVILSISSQRIIDAIARLAGEKRHHFPRILLTNLNHKGKEVLYTHEPFEGLPLERFSAVQTLFLLSHMHNKPVSLDTIASSLWTGDKKSGFMQDWYNYLERNDLDEDEILQRILAPEEITEERVMNLAFALDELAGEVMLQSSQIRISVFPDGTVKVFNLPGQVDRIAGLSPLKRKILQMVYGEAKEQEAGINEILTRQLQAGVDYYKEDISLTVNEQLAKAMADKVKDNGIPSWILGIDSTQTNNIASVVSKPHDSMLRHAPTAPDAIMDFERMIKERLPKAIQRALSGEGKFKTGKTGVKLRALPVVPSFRHDSEIASRLNQAKPPAPIDGRYDQNAMSVGVDDNSSLGSGVGMPGDIRPIPPKEQGKGEGEEGESEDGEPQEGQPEPSDQEPDDVTDADGASDPSVVEIPLDLWGELLNKHLELPNPRKTKGGARILDRERAGARTRDGEPVVWDQTIDEALRWGIAKNPDAVKAVPGESPAERAARVRGLFVEGLKMLPPEEYKVKAWQETTEPEFKAVVVFVLDLSGSMQGEPIQKSKEFIYNVTAFLKSRYPEVETRFVGYDTKAHEFSENKIFKTALGGATDDSVGYELANKILDEYDPKQYNMYVYGTGDGGGSKVAETIAELEKIYERAQHMGFVENQLGWTASPELLAAIKSLSEEYGWFDYSVINQDRNSVIRALNDFFGPGKNAGRGK